MSVMLSVELLLRSIRYPRTLSFVPMRLNNYSICRQSINSSICSPWSSLHRVSYSSGFSKHGLPFKHILNPPSYTFFKKDNVRRAQNVLVYQLHPKIRVALVGWWFSLVSTLLLGAVVTYISEPRAHEESPTKLEPGKLMPYIGLIVFSVYFSIFCLLASRTILRIYYDKNRDIFTVITMRPYHALKTNQMTIQAGKNVELKNIKSEKQLDNFWTAKLNGKKVLLYPTNFFEIAHFNRLFGFKDIDAILRFSGHKSLHEYFLDRDRSQL